MDERLLALYNSELRHLRQMGAEFAREYPKIAGRLALDRDWKETCPDPFVERLLEGFAFLTARVQLKLEAEFPRFTHGLLETVFPQYLSPTPSMAIVRFEPDWQEPALAKGYRIPRGTSLRSTLGANERTPCEYRTAHEVTLWPVQVDAAEYVTRTLGQLGFPAGLAPKAALLIRLRATGGLNFHTIAIDRLPFYLHADAELAGALFEELFAHGTTVLARPAGGRPSAWQPLAPGSLRRGGLSEEEALLPSSPRGFEGYRLLREYFAMPQRFLFVELLDLARARTAQSPLLEIAVVLDRLVPELEGRVDADCLAPFCAPAINLFPKRADRILLSDQSNEFQLVVDRTRPLDFEVFDVQQVTGYGALTGEEQEFRPFYQARDADTETGAFYTTHRVPRLVTERERRFGKVSDYGGSEIYLSLVDSKAAPYRSDLRELGVQALCTNRHLPIQMPVGVGRTDFQLQLSAPCGAIRCLGTPSPPVPSVAEGDTVWRIISHLCLNYLSLVDTDPTAGAAGLRDILKLYTNLGNKTLRRQLDGVRSVQSFPDVQRVPTPGPVSFARGLRIELTLDERSFEGASAFLLGSILEQFFARYVSINSFTRTVVRTEQRGELIRWPPRMGKRSIL